jgi:MoaA/NifB/PqqE/SkfB family radical SAM enzyme
MLQRAKRLLNLVGDKLYGLPLLVLYLTDGCNSRCVSCDIWQNPRLNMPMGLAKSLADTAVECDVRWVLLSGGEALQHPQWAQIAGMFKAQGVRVMLLTNGLFVKKYANEVAETVDDLIVSLDGGNASTYHALRGVDAFALVLEGIREARARGVSVTTRTTVQRANWHEMAQIIDVGLAHDVNAMSFLAVDVSNGLAFGQRALAEQSPLLPTLADVDALERQLEAMAHAYAPHFASGRIAETPAKLQRTLVRYFRALHGVGTFAPVPCNAPHFSVVVGVDGTLQPCYFLPAFGKLKPDGAPLQHALNSTPAQALRQAYKAGQRQECQTCVCPLYKDAKALWGM